MTFSLLIFFFQIAKNRCRSYQKKMFSNLLKTSLTYLYNTSLSDIMHHFSVNIYYGFHAKANILQSLSNLIVIIGLMIYINYFTSIVIGVILLFIPLIFWYLKYTVYHFKISELNTRRKMFTLLSNNLLGRAVIQSFDKIQEFSDRYISRFFFF